MAELHELERLYDEHAQPLFAFLLHCTRNEADAKDLLQEVFCRIAVTPSSVSNARSARAFLLRMAHNLVVDWARRSSTRKRKHEAFGAEPASPFSPAPDPDAEEFRSRLERALSDLPTEQRVVVHLRVWEGLTFDAVAEILDIPINTAASRYRYGIDKLRSQLRLIYEEL